MTDIVKSREVQNLLDRAAGLGESGGDPRLKAITRDLLEALVTIIEKHEIDENEFWAALRFLQDGVNEYGLIAPGLGIEHFLDLHMDARDAEAGLTGGTPRTIEGPLYVAGAPLVEGDLARTNDVNLTTDPDDTETLTMSGRVIGPEGEPVKDAILHVWHANSKGFYSHFDPTGAQSPFNNRRRIRLGPDGRYAFRSKMPRGYSVPPGGATERLMHALGRHGDRPAHVHFFIEAPGYRTLTTQINFGDDPRAHDDFAFGTREGLLPMPDRSGGNPDIAFDFQLQRARGERDEGLSNRARAAA
ncbi:dioxygenase [Novosphingobium album (ex Liu et al. 2023)]|uniref:Dioxygenase n=1 Tax=Novosphingobium album (ex Liu et al. 2023) TaxID=3031130 RepID=A0ABT5WPP1_9SPHN|nr:dioxygenase [Novosphingobium album (ex Liu et al. 2023)]MDE8652013.1 dioxygenase [Novosphingobium album (ex Liu et al. 2023)]